MVRHSRRNGELHLHAAGIFLDPFFNRQLKSRAERIIEPIIPIGINRTHNRRDILCTQHIVKKIFIEHYADLLLNFVLLLCRVQAEQGDLPAILFQQVQKQLERGAFARAIFSNQAHDAALRQVEADIF